jgi:hypothetical protein
MRKDSSAPTTYHRGDEIEMEEKKAVSTTICQLKLETKT